MSAHLKRNNKSAHAIEATLALTELVSECILGGKAVAASAQVPVAAKSCFQQLSKCITDQHSLSRSSSIPSSSPRLFERNTKRFAKPVECMGALVMWLFLGVFLPVVLACFV